jgi:hypothetical protein
MSDLVSKELIIFYMSICQYKGKDDFSFPGQRKDLCEWLIFTVILEGHKKSTAVNLSQT